MTDADKAAARAQAFVDGENCDAVVESWDPMPDGGRQYYMLSRTELRSVLADRMQSIALNAQLAKTLDLNAAIAEEANDENDELRARIAELTARVIAAESSNMDAADLARENAELRRQCADAPTTEAAVAQLREWVPAYEVGATHVAMPVAMARKLLATIDGEGLGGFDVIVGDDDCIHLARAGLMFRNFASKDVGLSSILAAAVEHNRRCPGRKQPVETEAAADDAD